VRGERPGKNLGQHDDTRLAHAVRGVAGPWLQSTDVGKVHDLALRLPEPRQGTLHREESGAKVDRHRLVPQRRCSVFDGSRLHDAGGVDEDVQTTEALGYLSGKRLRCFGVGQVGLEDLGRSPRRLNLLLQFFRTSRRIIVVNGEHGTALGHTFGDGAPDPTAASRYERDSVSEFHPQTGPLVMGRMWPVIPDESDPARKRQAEVIWSTST